MARRPRARRAAGTRSVGPPARAPRPAPLPERRRRPAVGPGSQGRPNPSRDGPGALCRPLPPPKQLGLRGAGRGAAGGGGRGGAAPHPGPPRRVLADPGGVRSPQFLGRWFTSGLASNSSWFREKKKVLSVCVSVVAPSADGGLNLTSTFLRCAGPGFWGPELPAPWPRPRDSPWPDP